MNYMGNSEWWNERFRNRKLKISEHERCLEEDLTFFQEAKTILDLASGDGRNAVYLAKMGFKVHAVEADFSRETI